MNGANADQLPDLDSLDIQALKALVLAKQSELDSRRTEIENLKLFILKLKRMQFGPRSEKFTRDLAQLELQLEDLEASQAAAEPEPAPQATTVPGGKRKPARRPLPASLPRETETIAPKQESCPACGGGLKLLGADVSETLEYIPASFKVIRNRLRTARSRAAWRAPDFWRMCWLRSSPTTCRFTGNRRSSNGRASNWSGPRWPTGSAARARHCSLWWMS